MGLTRENFRAVIICCVVITTNNRILADAVRSAQATATLKIDVHKPIRENLPSDFLSVGIDSSIIYRDFCGLNFRKATPLGRALAPGTLRIGGNDADIIVFDPDADEDPTLRDNCTTLENAKLGVNDVKPAILTGKAWDTLYRFANETGLRILFDFNVLLRKKGRWNSTNARTFLDYSRRRGYVNMDFELGNEPNAFLHMYNKSVSPVQLARDYAKLRRLLNTARFRRSYERSEIVGPSVTNLLKAPTVQYLNRFLKRDTATNDISFHSYYVNSRNTSLGDFVNPQIFDRLKAELATVVLLRRRHLHHHRRFPWNMWLGETASAYGGGAVNLSDTYAAGFMWMDKLGLSAAYGLSKVVRQSLYHAHYALLDDDCDPNPDYWLSLLFKRVVGAKVYNVSVNSLDREFLRFYAASGAKAHSLVIYGMNLLPNQTASIVLDIAPCEVGSIGQYLLEPVDKDLQSKC